MNLSEASAIYAGGTAQTAAFVGKELVWPDFLPTALSGLRLWLDAAVGLFDATTGGNPVTTQGGTIARWEDKSGNNRHATSSAEPTLALNQIASKPAIRFGGSSFFKIPSSITGLSASTAFVVVRPSGYLNYSGGPLFGNIGAATLDFGASHYPYTSASAIYDSFASSTRKQFSVPTGFIGQAGLYNWHIYNVVSAQNDWRYLFNGSVHFSTTSNTYDTSTLIPSGGSISEWGPFIGRSKVSDTQSAFFLGDIAEILVYGALLSYTDIFRVTSYLRKKYSI
jgi:hypothetical protein